MENRITANSPKIPLKLPKKPTLLNKNLHWYFWMGMMKRSHTSHLAMLKL
ncbi:hypothetical protein F7734_30075 [Scytonema sp. UIC 10036]|nr:hypothetical protein [Scytonema sp. UIC 10036]MUG96362.1 hypothetical protein [Scytonema sp. UIC 10036]